jgi:hypothetical protein
VGPINCPNWKSRLKALYFLPSVLKITAIQFLVNMIAGSLLVTQRIAHQLGRDVHDLDHTVVGHAGGADHA